MWSNVLVANIILSYALWVLISILLSSRIKNVFLYVLFTEVLYSLPVVYFTLVRTRTLYLIPTLLSYVALICLPRIRALQKAWLFTLIPLPLILCITYEALVIWQ